MEIDINTQLKMALYELGKLYWFKNRGIGEGGSIERAIENHILQIKALEEAAHSAGISPEALEVHDI